MKMPRQADATAINVMFQSLVRLREPCAICGRKMWSGEKKLDMVFNILGRLPTATSAFHLAVDSSICTRDRDSGRTNQTTRIKDRCIAAAR